jgi:hypothetical protein
VSGKVSLQINVKLPLNQVLLESEVEIIEEYGEKVVQTAKDQWTNWRYDWDPAYNERYPKWQKGTSHGAWQWMMLQPTGSGYRRGLRLFNDAEIQAPTEPRKNGKPRSTRSVGRKYARYVTRSGQMEPEWRAVRKRIQDDIIDDFTRDLKRAIQSNAGKTRARVEVRDVTAGIPAGTFDIFDETFSP